MTISRRASNGRKLNSSEGSQPGRFSINRRTFLKLTIFSAVAALASRLVSRPAAGSSVSPPEPEGIVTEQWIATSCLNCPARCATRVRVVNGKAVRITGNPLSKVTEGEICPRGHIGLQVLYDPSRVNQPLRRTNPLKGRGVDPGWVPISWPEALSEVVTRLKSLRDKAEPHKLLLLHGLNTTSDEDVLQAFAGAYGTPNIISGDSLENESEKLGRWLADGQHQHCAYDFGQANYILAFGAGIVESERPLARNLRLWGKIRQERPNRARVVVIDPRYSVTAAKADRWLPIKPGTDAALAMAIAGVIISEGLYDADFVRNWTDGFDDYKGLALKDYTPEKVAAITGIEADAIRQIAREFAQTKPALAWAGRGIAAWPNGTYSSYAVFCLNALVGSIDTPGGIVYQEDPPYRPLPETVEDDIARQGKARPRLDFGGTSLFPAAAAVTNQVADSIREGNPYPIEMAIGLNANFNMSAPGTWRWDEALKKIPYYVHIAPFTSEMAAYADVILPASTFLEEWGYDHTPPGSGFAEARIKQPVVKPQHDTKSLTDIILAISRSLGGTVASSFTRTGDDAQGLVRYRTETFVPWAEFQEKGIWAEPVYRYGKYDRIFKTTSRKFEFHSDALEKILEKSGKGIARPLAGLPHYESPEFLGDEASYPLMLSTYQPLMTVENGSQNYPWAQEILLVMHGFGWTNFVEINNETARDLGIRDRDMVWVESPFNRIKVRARVIAGIHPQVVSIPRGQGHYATGQWHQGIGVNPNEIIGVSYDHLSGQSALFNTRVKVYKA